MFRFALGNLSDFTTDDALPWAALPLIDRYLLSATAACSQDVSAAFQSHRFDQALAAFEAFSSVLSNFYFTAVKDRLYCEIAASRERRAVQTVIDSCLRLLLPQLAPLLPFLAEEVFAAAPHDCPPQVCLMEAVQRRLWTADSSSWRLEEQEQRAMDLALLIREVAATWAADRGKKSPAGAQLVVRPEAAEVTALLRLVHPGAGAAASSLREATRCAQAEVLPHDAVGPESADFLPLESPWGRCGLFLRLRPKSFTCSRCRMATKSEEEEQLCRRCAKVLAAG